MTQSGYYRFPSIQGDTIVFTSEDDLWMVPAGGGVARRLTSSLSNASRPHLSPDGRWLAFVAEEDGHPELYVMPAIGGEARRLTYYGGITRPVAWTVDAERIVYVTNHGQPFPNMMRAWTISPDGGGSEPVDVGPANNVSFGPNGGVVIGRATADPARWKRYRGGTAGVLWVDATGDGNFKQLITLNGNLASPMWVGDRIYFVSDHEGYGNIYSCTTDGAGLKRHTDHSEFYARNPHTDGNRIVYHAGGDLYLLDPASDRGGRVEVTYHSPRSQRSRKFVPATEFLQDYSLNPEGHTLALVVRGKPVTVGAFAGAATQFGLSEGVRYRDARYLNDARRLVAITDSMGEERLVILDAEDPEAENRIDDLDVGRPVDMRVSPTDDVVALSNHRNEIIVVDLKKPEMTVVDRSNTLHNGTIAFSPDGRFLAFNHAENPEMSYLMIHDLDSGENHRVTDPLLHDVEPSFDPDGRYLYFLSYREFNPVYDNMHFDLGFPRGMRPYLVTLRRDIDNPFLPVPKAPQDPTAAKKDDEHDEDSKNGKPKKVKIDFDGITRRMVPIPFDEGKYTQIAGVKNKVYVVSTPVVGSMSSQHFSGGPPANNALEYYDLETHKVELIDGGMNEMDVNNTASTIVYRSGSDLRVLLAGAKPDDKAGDEAGIESGWVDLDRVKVAVTPGEEWRQMYHEAWRLQREFFWTEGMLGIDWDSVYQRYLPLVERLGSRGETSDLIWEMQGELGTSHAYEIGGDYRRSPKYAQGFLGADFIWDKKADAWIVSHIVRGDSWSDDFGSPLESPGVNIGEGDAIVAINGRKLTHEHTPQLGLVNTAGSEITVTYRPKGSKDLKTARLKTLRSETPPRYRQWVEANRRYVHEATDGRVGYVHVPNMGPWGYSEFHRGFLSEVWRGSMIVDVRFNGGGHVSQLILEKLSRRRIGYNQARYSMPEPYPSHSLGGPVVAITNEYAGSDGDIFSHGFKMMKLGPLVGKRTWGGVVGIWPRNPLVDGSVTTQPEFSFWFEDVQWGVENYGTDPDIEVEIRPQDYVSNTDPQLERAIREVLTLIEQNGHQMPDLSKRPVLKPAPLPEWAE